ncbi:MAG: hypothetical protein IJW05_00180 [Lentisphaeria bacterium]|nr:hypothetical protein [Lentisphaeria bacterium]
MKIWAKIEKNTVVYPPKNDKTTGCFNVDQNESWLKEHGFKQYDPAELQTFYPEPEMVLKKYSTLKIIRILGNDWESFRQQLQSEGVLDQFFAANYIAEDDPVFLAFLETVPEEVKSKLILCEWNS